MIKLLVLYQCFVSNVVYQCVQLELGKYFFINCKLSSLTSRFLKNF